MNIFWNSQVRNLGVERTEAKVTIEIAAAAMLYLLTENDMETEAPTCATRRLTSRTA